MKKRMRWRRRRRTARRRSLTQPKAPPQQAPPVATEVAVPVESSGGNDKPTVYTMLKELKGLLDVGVLSQAEFDEQKQAILLSS